MLIRKCSALILFAHGTFENGDANPLALAAKVLVLGEFI